jgi:hypothetical protein
MYSCVQFGFHFFGNYLPDVVTIPTHKRENPSHTDKILVCDIVVQLCVCKSQDTGTFKNIEPCGRNCEVLVPSLLFGANIQFLHVNYTSNHWEATTMS